MTRVTTSLTFALSLTLSSGGPSSALAAAPLSSAEVFKMRLIAEPETLDWNRAHTMVETYVLMNMMEGLLTFDSNFKVAPALAASWKLSPDGRVYTFTLRQGVRWSDGVPLKAQDFVYSWKRLLTPETAASYSYFLYDIEGAEDFGKGRTKDFSRVGIKALDDRHLEVRLAKPVAHWIYMPTFWVTFPLREDVVTRHGDSWAQPGKAITLGPYLLSDHKIDQQITLTANPNYYGKRGTIQEIDGLIIKDESTALTLYEAGKIDFMTDIGAVDLLRLQGRKDLKSYPYLKIGYLGFAQNLEPMTQVHLRRAVSLAINKAELAGILHGSQKPAHSFVPPGIVAHSEHLGLGYDVARAKKELALTRLDPSKIKLDLLTPSWEKQLTLCQFIQQELKKNLGIQVEIKSFDHKTFRSELNLRRHALFLGSWSADYPDPDNFLSILLADSGNNKFGWKSEQFDRWVTQARHLTKSQERSKLYTQAQRLMLEEDAVLLPLYYEPNLALVKDRVKGLVLNPLNYLLLKDVQLSH